MDDAAGCPYWVVRSLCRCLTPSWRGFLRGGAARVARQHPLIDGPVRASVHQAEVIGVSPKVAWGNVASGVNGAAAMVAGARPDRAAAVQSVAGGLLAEPALRGRSEGEPGRLFGVAAAA